LYLFVLLREGQIRGKSKKRVLIKEKGSSENSLKP
jgi:hypothetical protein